MRFPLLSHNQHFSYGLDSNNKWTVAYGKATRPVLSFKEECIANARAIRSNTNQEIWVLFSGGADSEVALRSFVDAGIAVKAAILKFKDDLNDHDISYAFSTCEKLNVPYKIFELDLFKFWEEECLSYAEATRCISPQLLTTMYLIDQIDGYPVLGSGECLLVKEDEWYLLEKEKIASWYRHFEVTKRDGCPGFFQYTPEIMLSYLLDPMIQSLINGNFPFKSSADIKLEMYQSHFQLEPRPKFTGFEKVQLQDFLIRTKLKALFPNADQVYKSEYKNLVKALKGTNWKITPITFDEIYPTWNKELWPNRESPIEPVSAIDEDGSINMEIMKSCPVFLGCHSNETGKLIGVISGFKTSGNSFRSRGIWVSPEVRNKGLGEELIRELEKVAINMDCRSIWTMARLTACSFYERLGFLKILELHQFEFGPHVICRKDLLKKSD